MRGMGSKEEKGFCIILEGFVEVVDQGDSLAVLGRGDCFGLPNLHKDFVGIETLGELKAQTHVKLLVIGPSYFYRIP